MIRGQGCRNYRECRDVEAAVAATTRDYHERRGWLEYVKVNPVMDPMRGHPRFDSLMRRLGV